MRLQELAQALDLEVLTPDMDQYDDGRGDRGDDTRSNLGAGPDITHAYASDLMSDVLANAPMGAILVTLQVHLNVIAVAGHAGLRAVIFACGRRPDEDAIEKAPEEGLSLYLSRADTFNIAGRLYELGLRGGSE